MSLRNCWLLEKICWLLLHWILSRWCPTPGIALEKNEAIFSISFRKAARSTSNSACSAVLSASTWSVGTCWKLQVGSGPIIWNKIWRISQFHLRAATHVITELGLYMHLPCRWHSVALPPNFHLLPKLFSLTSKILFHLLGMRLPSGAGLIRVDGT